MTLASDPDVLDPKFEATLDGVLSAALLAWQRDVGAHVIFGRLLAGGYTRARVFLIVVDEVAGAVRKCVLKAVPAGERGGQEGDVHAAALASGTAEFVAAHLVEQPYPQRVSAAGGVIMFQAVAGGDMSKFRPLSTLWQNGDLPRVAARIARSLLEDWNPDPSVEAMTAQDCVRRQLGRRGEPGGALERWVSTVGDGAASRWVRFEAGAPALPNPLVWLVGDVDQAMLVHLGRAHGDLHLDNIFVPFVPAADADGYRLIDLSEFCERGPLCRDVPHLLLATIGRHLVDVPTGRRRSLAARIIDSARGAQLGPGTIADQGYERLAEELLAAGDQWASGHDMLDDWRCEQLLGVIAAALTQASVSIHQPEVRWWFFELAAVGLARRLGEVPAPAEDEVALVGPAAGLRGNVAAMAERLDEVVAGFSRRKATVLLVGEGGLDDPAEMSRQRGISSSNSIPRPIRPAAATRCGRPIAIIDWLASTKRPRSAPMPQSGWRPTASRAGISGRTTSARGGGNACRASRRRSRRSPRSRRVRSSFAPPGHSAARPGRPSTRYWTRAPRGPNS